MTASKSSLFNEEEFRLKTSHMVSKKDVKGIVNSEEDSHTSVNINDKLIHHLEMKYINFLQGNSMPF